jgi:hypothetical protein
VKSRLRRLLTSVLALAAGLAFGSRALAQDQGGKEFVPANERIAVFDSDGTLWSEQPAYFQLLFAIDRVRALAASGEKGLLTLAMASHAGMTPEELRKTVYLRASGFETHIVSGGDIEFVRAWSEEVYGVPMLVRQPAINFIGDKEGDPVGILQHVGRRPTAAFGNSDGDFRMLEWATSGAGAASTRARPEAGSPSA